MLLHGSQSSLSFSLSRCISHCFYHILITFCLILFLLIFFSVLFSVSGAWFGFSIDEQTRPYQPYRSQCVGDKIKDAAGWVVGGRHRKEAVRLNPIACTVSEELAKNHNTLRQFRSAFLHLKLLQQKNKVLGSCSQKKEKRHKDSQCSVKR